MYATTLYFAVDCLFPFCNFLLISWLPHLPAADKMSVILGVADTERKPEEEIMAGGPRIVKIHLWDIPETLPSTEETHYYISTTTPQ